MDKICVTAYCFSTSKGLYSVIIYDFRYLKGQPAGRDGARGPGCAALRAYA